MNLKTEPTVFLLFAAWVGYGMFGASSGDDGPMRGGNRGRATQMEYEPARDPRLEHALGSGISDGFSRDMFSPPRDTAPLPPLEIALPPMERLPALRPPTAFGPGTSQAHLLVADATPAYIPALFEAPAPPEESGDNVITVDPDAMTAAQRAARLEALKKIHDWTVVDNRLMFGQIRNKSRFDLAQSATEPLLFVEIDPETGLEVYPGQQPFEFERGRVDEFGLADTPENFVELGLRQFQPPLRHTDIHKALTFAEECIDLRNETDRGLAVAEQIFRLILEAGQNDVEAQLGLARCFELGFRFEEAFGIYQSMTQGEYKVEARPWARMGTLMARFRLFDRAEEAFLESLRRQGSSWEGRWRYGRFLLERGRAAEALEHLEEASDSEPDGALLRWARVQIRSDLAHCLLRLGRVQEAFNRFERASSADPSVDLGLAGMLSAGIFLEDAALPEGDTPDASFDLMLARGLASLHEQDWLEARLELERAAEADPFRAWMAWRALSWLAEITGHPEEAMTFIERAYRAEPTDAWTLYQLGRLLAASGDRPNAKAAFTAALDQDLNFADALIGLAHLSQLDGEHEAAERYYHRALSVDDDRPIALSLRGFNHFQLGEPGAAGDDFRAAVASRSNLASARNGLAWWYYATGDSEESKTRFDYVVEERRTAPENDPHRAYAIAQRERILDHESKEVWTDRFDRVGSIANDWNLDESAGVISRLQDGQVWLEGRFDKSGQGRVYQVLPAERFLSIEATVTIHDQKEVNIGLFVSKEQEGRSGTKVQSRVSLRRNRAGQVQVTFIKKGKHEEEVIDLSDTLWPIGHPMSVRITTNGEPTDTRMSIWLDDLPVIEGLEVQSLGRSQMPVRIGVYVEGESARTGTVSMDDVHIVRRK